jgi:hypothetical protein
MDDLRRRFADLDRLRAPDLWDEIELRAAALGSTQRLTPVPVPVTRSRGFSGGSLVVLLAALALLVALLVGAIAVGSGLIRLPAIMDRTPPPAQVLDFPNLTTTFVSPRNGFSMKHPDRVALTPAEQLWGFSEQVDDGFDVVETGLAAVFKGASTNSGFGGGGSIDERVDEYLSGDYGTLSLPDGCGVPRSQQAEITIDGQPGRITECANRIEATVVAGGRLYLFTLLHDRGDARAVFDAFVATIDLTPETAVDYPGLTTTFVSPTYGYSFKYLDRGPVRLPTELWDPVNQQFDISINRFDAVGTGLGAYLEGASTPIPDGVSIDEWVDEYVTPIASGGCGVPRSQQAEITIDGQPGRIAECSDQIEATVVVDGRLYLFILSHSRSDARAFFDAWIATIDLTPETAAVP